ncbi:unnamed protein product [Mucor fragilis]
MDPLQAIVRSGPTMIWCALRYCNHCSCSSDGQCSIKPILHMCPRCLQNNQPNVVSSETIFPIDMNEKIWQFEACLETTSQSIIVSRDSGSQKAALQEHRIDCTMHPTWRYNTMLAV